MIIAGSEGGQDGGEGGNHGVVVFGGHGADKDCVEVINVGHKDILHRPEGAEGEGTRKISVHGAGGEVGEGRSRRCRGHHRFLRLVGARRLGGVPQEWPVGGIASSGYLVGVGACGLCPLR